MKKFKTRNLLLFTLGIFVAVLCCGFSFMGIFANAFTTSEVPNYLIDNGNDIYDYNNNRFSKARLNALAVALGSDNFDDLVQDAKVGNTATTGAKNSADFNGNVTVKFGGLIWTPVYLSTTDGTSTGTPILTLWLADSTQLSRSSSPFSGDASGNGWGFSDTYVGFNDTYSPGMYGTSYMRAVTLNNGGRWAIDYYNLSSSAATPDPSNDFAQFTMPQSDLNSGQKSFVDYIVTPSQVSWQALQKSSNVPYSWDSGSINCDTPNDSFLKSGESFNGNTFTTNYYNSCSFEWHSDYSVWKDDKIWLPSITETGFSDRGAGLWECSVEQLRNADGVSNLVGGIRPYMTRLRSSLYDKSELSLNIRAFGACDYSGSGDTVGVRPALHLNLKLVADNAGCDVPEESNNKYSAVYDSAIMHTFNLKYDTERVEVLSVEGKDFGNPSGLIPSSNYSLTNNDTVLNLKEAGKYTVKFA